MSKKIRKIAGLGLLVAIECILCLITYLIPNSTTNINLGIVVIVIGSVVYGPYEGMFLGIINGVFNIIAPVNIIFINETLIGTILCCLIKTAVAGFVSGYIYKWFKNKKIGVVVSSIVVVLVNTLIFCIFASFIYEDVFNINNEGINTFIKILLACIGINFVVELATSLVLSNAVYRIIEVKNRRDI